VVSPVRTRPARPRSVPWLVPRETRAAETARRLVEAFNVHDRCAIRALAAPGAVFEGPGGIRVEGRDAAAGAYVVTLLDGFPDATMTIRNQFGSGCPSTSTRS